MAARCTVGDVKSVDMTIPEIRNEQISAEFAELRRRQRETPGGVQFSVGYEPLNLVSIQVEDVQEAVDWPGNVIMLVLVLEGESYIQFVVDVLNSKWGIARRQVGISKILHPREVRVVHFHRATAEVIGIDERAVRCGANRQALVNCRAPRVIYGKNGVEQVYARTPAADRPILSGENEQ